MKLLLLFLLTIFSTLSSCNYNEKSYRLIEKLSIESLHNSNIALSQLSNSNYQALKEKLKDVTYGEKAELWNEKATKLKIITSNVLNRISENVSKDILPSLKRNYISDVISIDNNLKNVFKQDIDSFLTSYDETISPLFNVEKTQNDILILESKFSGYFNNNVGAIIEDYTTFSTLLGQNTNHLKSGEILKVSAGIGAYTMAANPIFIINNDTVNPQEGRANYKLKVIGQGKKSIPVKIIYTSSKGLQESKNFTLDYYIDK